MCIEWIESGIKKHTNHTKIGPKLVQQAGGNKNK